MVLRCQTPNSTLPQEYQTRLGTSVWRGIGSDMDHLSRDTGPLATPPRIESTPGGDLLGTLRGRDGAGYVTSRASLGVLDLPPHPKCLGLL